MLSVKGPDMIGDNGEKIVLRGFNLGNLALIEPNMFGTPGTEHRLRRAMRLYAGEKKTDYFFRGLNNKWVTEDDIAFLKGLGCNSLRIPLNYRYFESDADPYHYLEEGFQLIDRILGYCRKYEIYAVIDLHAVQGCQSGDWHCDNIFAEQVNIYYDALCQDRYYALWKEIARRYCKESWVAGYDIMNEPVADGPFEVKVLNEIYRKVTAEIRTVDRDHIIFIEGNTWAQDFEDLEAPFDDNTVYSNHYYCDAAVTPADYPGRINGEYIDIHKMESDMDKRDWFMQKHQIPCWVGEFGTRRLGDLDGKRQSLADYLTVFEERGHSWCYWNFKDLSLRGPIYLDEESAWCRFLRKIQPLKDKYHTDRSMPLGDAWELSDVFGTYEDGDFVLGLSETREILIRNMRETLGDQLTLRFAQLFAELSEEEINELTDSFLFCNCKIYEPWIDLFTKFMK